MLEEDILEMKPVALVDVKDVIKARKAEKELNYEQDLTLKYVEKFSRLTKKQTSELVKDLSEISFLSDKVELVYQIVYTLPTTIDQVKLFVPKDVDVSDDDLNQIIVLVKKFEKKE